MAIESNDAQEKPTEWMQMLKYKNGKNRPLLQQNERNKLILELTHMTKESEWNR